ncbi:hypothetical protein SSTU70S_02919 [Stutzerimonas stutzeri]
MPLETVVEVPLVGVVVELVVDSVVVKVTALTLFGAPTLLPSTAAPSRNTLRLLPTT